MSSPVAGFRPLRSRFSLTQNLPNPEIRTSSPDARDDLIISRIVSTVFVDFILLNLFCWVMALIKWDFVMVMGVVLRCGQECSEYSIIIIICKYQFCQEIIGLYELY